GARVRCSLVFFRVDKVRPQDTEAVAARDPRSEGDRGYGGAAGERNVVRGGAGGGRLRGSVQRAGGAVDRVAGGPRGGVARGGGGCGGWRSWARRPCAGRFRRRIVGWCCAWARRATARRARWRR